MTSILDVLWHGLRDALLMAWTVWWALVLGFAISAIVQAWVPRSRIDGRRGAAPAPPPGPRCWAPPPRRARMPRWRSPGRCLPRARPRPAHWPSSSPPPTWCGSSGWCCGSSSGGIRGGRVPRRDRDDRAHGGGAAPARSPEDEAHARQHAEQADPATSITRPPADGPAPEAGQLVEAWSDVAHNFRGDWQMLWKEITIGFLLAGYVAQIPNSVFQGLFLHNAPAPLPAIENAIVGPIIAVLSFVCSVGNVPLAAVLWSGGIGFAGVLAFLFADLIVLPIMAIYRKYYGGRFALRITLLMFVTMVVAALLVTGLFSAARPRPHRASAGPRRHLRSGPPRLQVRPQPRGHGHLRRRCCGSPSAGASPTRTAGCGWTAPRRSPVTATPARSTSAQRAAPRPGTRAAWTTPGRTPTRITSRLRRRAAGSARPRAWPPPRPVGARPHPRCG